MERSDWSDSGEVTVCRLARAGEAAMTDVAKLMRCTRWGGKESKSETPAG